MNLTLKKTNTHPLVPFAVSALVVTLFLFYIDEGNYSFENIFHPGNIVALAFYFIGIMLMQALILAVAERFVKQRRAILTAIIMGIPLGIALTILFFLFLRS